MRKVVVGLVVVLTACGPSADTPSTSASAPITTAPATTVPTIATLPMEMQDCDAPPVTFSALCEVYDLLQEWHMDRPIPSSTLADVALRGLEGQIATSTEPPPRTLFCSVPHQDFEEFCQELAEMVTESGIAIEPAVDAAVSAMTDLALDAFTYYVPPDHVGSYRQDGVVAGVGILLDATNSVGSKCARISSTCPLKIVFVLEGNPAAEAGLRAGDQILSIDGQDVAGEGFAAAGAAIAGDETGSVTITVDRDGEPLEFDIERASLVVPTVAVELPLPDVGYLRIPDFEDDIGGLVEDALTSLTSLEPETIVVDLRDNPGGYVDTAVAVASLFIDGGPVMETSASGVHREYPAAEGGVATSERLVVLVNRGTASAAEVVAGALRDRRSAVVVGTHTFGKDAVQIPFELRNGGELYVAVARWSTPSGTTAGNGGLAPDRELELAADLPVDELVEAALDAAS